VPPLEQPIAIRRRHPQPRQLVVRQRPPLKRLQRRQARRLLKPRDRRVPIRRPAAPLRRARFKA
jgi:hypothetical protein